MCLRAWLIGVVMAGFSAAPAQAQAWDGRSEAAQGPTFIDRSEFLAQRTTKGLGLFRVADVDQDLDLDLVEIVRGRDVMVLRNDGTGRFTEAIGAVSLNVPRERFFDLQLKDVTGDGVPDLLLGDAERAGGSIRCYVFENDGSGRFTLSSSVTVRHRVASSIPAAFELGDVDQDGDLDVVVALIGEPPRLLLNDGQGRFAPGPDLAVPSQGPVPSLSKVAVVDVDGDGDVDVLLASQKPGRGAISALTLLINQGGLRFDDVTARQLPLHLEGINALAVGRLNRDDAVDLVVGGWMSPVRLYRNSGTGTFTEQPGHWSGVQGALAITAVDVDQDGDEDLVVAAPVRGGILMNDGEGRFTSSPAPPIMVGSIQQFVTGDIDGDGDSDVFGLGTRLHLFMNSLLSPGQTQMLFAQAGAAVGANPATTPLGFFGDIAPPMPSTPPMSLGVDLGAMHPAIVSRIELFATSSIAALTAANLAIYQSDDNVTYRPYEGSLVFSNHGDRLTLSQLRIASRYLKVHFPDFVWPNFVSESIRVFGAIPQAGDTAQFLDDLERRTFLYFKQHVNAAGLIPDRVALVGGQPVAGAMYSTGATGFWLAALPIGVERGWLPRDKAAALARRTLESYLGIQRAPVAGRFGFFYHFVNGDGTRFMGFDGDGVSILDSTLLFVGALACSEYFDGDVRTLGQQLVDQADWDAFFDHANSRLYLVWTPERGFERSLDYYSEGVLSYLLAAGSSTHPVRDGYYAFSRGNFGRVLGRFGRDGRPMLQSFFGSLFTHLYAPLLVDLNGLRDAFHINWHENTREAVLANFQFAQAHPEFGYDRLFWGISASDGPFGYQARYGTLPLDRGAGEPVHDGTVAPYALAGSLPFAADLALPALKHLAGLQGGRLGGPYGLTDSVNVERSFFGTEYVGIDEGALLVGLEQYRSGLIGQLTRRHPLVQRALSELGFGTAATAQIELTGPRSAHAYLLIDAAGRHTASFTIPLVVTTPAGDALLELHPHGIDTAVGKGFVDVDLSVNGQFVKTLRFLDRRGDGTVDVGSVYVPLRTDQLVNERNIVTLTWVGGERWVQLDDVEFRGPTGRMGSQDTWQIGQRDGSSGEFGDERLVDDSYVVGDDPATMERALNVVDEPTTDLLFELSDVSANRILRLVANQTQNDHRVAVEVSVNQALAGVMTLRSGEEATLSISSFLLRSGWNQITLRHANVPSDGEFITWDAIGLERENGTSGFQVIVRKVADGQVASEVHFDGTPPAGAIIPARDYLEIQYDADAAFDRLTISTDNRHAPLHSFTGPPEASAAGLVGTIDSTVTAPLLWQVYDEPQAAAPVFTDTTEWAFIPDSSDSGFDGSDALKFRTLVSRDGLGDRPSPGRSASSPIAVYLVGAFEGKSAQPYATDRLVIERIEQ